MLMWGVSIPDYILLSFSAETAAIASLSVHHAAELDYCSFVESVSSCHTVPPKPCVRSPSFSNCSRIMVLWTWVRTSADVELQIAARWMRLLWYWQTVQFTKNCFLVVCRSRGNRFSAASYSSARHKKQKTYTSHFSAELGCMYYDRLRWVSEIVRFGNI